jgi:hypothetical protein
MQGVKRALHALTPPSPSKNVKGIKGPVKIDLKPITLVSCIRSAGRAPCVDTGVPNDILHELFRRLRQREFSFVVISILTGGKASNS